MFIGTPLPYRPAAEVDVPTGSFGLFADRAVSKRKLDTGASDGCSRASA